MNIKIPNIEGIRSLEHEGAINAGALSLPTEFNSKKYSAKWVKKGPQVEVARQPQRLGDNAAADGWQVYKHKGQICQRPLSGGMYILMFRPRALQQAVNAIQGNVSRARIVREKNGETIEGSAHADPGILTNSKLQQLENAAPEPDDIAMAFNRIEPLSEVGASRGTSKPKR